LKGKPLVMAQSVKYNTTIKDWIAKDLLEILERLPSYAAIWVTG
jgi:hypothetical protein